MMWSVREPSSPPWTDAVVEPLVVLYEFDGPLTFVARFGFFDALFHKVGDRDGSQFFLVAQTNFEIIDALKAGNLSVRGALNADNYWIVRFNERLEIVEYWSCFYEDVPQKFMPTSGVPIYAHLPRAADSIEQATAFFAVRFKGRELTRESMPFNLFKDLTNKTYDAARKILSPEFLAGARSVTFDFNVRPAVGSLILALSDPIVDKQQLKRRTRQNPVPVSEVGSYFDAQKDAFFNGMDEVVTVARKGTIDAGFAAERFILLDNIHELVPNSDSRVELVEFTERGDDGYRNLVVTENTGLKIREAIKTAEDNIVKDGGTVDQVNWSRHWFVYKSLRGKSVTCVGSGDEFESFILDPRLKNGAFVTVRGKLTRRSRRDHISAIDVPEISDNIFS